MLRIHRLATAILILSASAASQIIDGNVSYAWTPPTATQLESIDPNFSANPSITDVLFEQWWAYRINNDPDEIYLDSTNLVIATSGSHADFDWTDVGGRGLIDAALDLDVASTGSFSGELTASMTITNISTAVITLNLFHYVDLDICSAVPNSASGTPFAHDVSSALCPTEIVTVEAAQADRWCAAPFSFNDVST